MPMHPSEEDFRDVSYSVQERLCPTCKTWRLCARNSSMMVCERCRGAEVANLQVEALQRLEAVVRYNHQGGCLMPTKLCAICSELSRIEDQKR